MLNQGTLDAVNIHRIVSGHHDSLGSVDINLDAIFRLHGAQGMARAVQSSFLRGADVRMPCHIGVSESTSMQNLAGNLHALYMKGVGYPLMPENGSVIVYSHHASEQASLGMGKTGTQLVQSPAAASPFNIVIDCPLRKITVFIGIVPYRGR